MLIKSRFFITIISLFFLINSNIQAQTLAEATILSQKGLFYDARALGMGNAHSTLNENYSALQFNPATLGMINQVTFSASIQANAMQNEATYHENITKFTSTSGSLSQFGISIPIETDSARYFVIALGYTQPTDFNYALQFKGYNDNPKSFIQNGTMQNDPLLRKLGLSFKSIDATTGNYLGDETRINGRLEQEGYIVSEGGLNKWSMGFAYEFAPNVYFGASGNYNIGTVEFDNEIFERDIDNNYGQSFYTNPENLLTNDFQEYYKHEIKEWVFNGWDAKFGLLYKMWNFVSIGASIKLPTQFNIFQNSDISGYAIYANDVRIDTSFTIPEIEYSIKTPFEYTFSAVANLWIIRASAEATYIDYSQMRFDGDLNKFEMSDLNKGIKEDFTGVLNVNAGAEVDIPFTGISGRAGFILHPSPYDQENLDFAKKYLTVGLGFNSGQESKLEVSLAYAYGWWDAEKQTYEDELANNRQFIQRHNGMLSFVLRF